MSLYFALLTVENNKNKKSVKFQGDMLNFYDFIQVFVFTTNHHLNSEVFQEVGKWFDTLKVCMTEVVSDDNYVEGAQTIGGLWRVCLKGYCREPEYFFTFAEIFLITRYL